MNHSCDLKEQAIKNFKDLYNTGIEFFLMDGTLMGAYRDGNFCVNDWDDIDIGILDKDYDKQTERLVKKLEKVGFQKYKEFIHRNKLEGFGIKRGDSHIDVIRINKHPKRPECYNFGRMGDKVLAFVYKSIHFKKSDKILFQGLNCKIPFDASGFLTERYGDWKIKIDRPNFVWHKNSNNNSIRYEYDQI